MLKVSLKGLMAHKMRFVMTAVSIMLGIAFLSGTMVFTDTIQRTFDDLFADIFESTDAVVRAPAEFEGSFGDQRPRVPASLLDDVRAVDGVEAAAGDITVPYAQVVDDENDPVGNPAQGAPAFGFAWSEVPELNPWVMSAGRPPEADDEIAVDHATADAADLAVGDTVRVLTNKPPRDYTLVGTARFGTVDSPAGASVVLFTLPQAQAIMDAPDTFDAVFVVADDGVSQDEVKANLVDALGAGDDVEVVTGAEITEENQDAIKEQLGFFNIALTAFAVVALIVSVFIIYNTFSIVVAQRTRELALLRAIGASFRQVWAAVLGEAIVVGLIASGLGIASGVALSAGLVELLAAVGVDIPAGSAVVKASTVVVGLVVGLVVTVLSALFPARRAGKVPPIAALRDVAFERPPRTLRRAAIGTLMTAAGVGALMFGLFGDLDNGLPLVGLGALLTFVGVVVLTPLFARGLARTLGRPLRSVRGLTGELARENAARNPRRTATTAASLMLGVALVGFITIFAASAKASIGEAIDEQMRTDYVVTSGMGWGTGLSPTLAQSIAELPEIEELSPLRFGEAKIDGSVQFLAAADPGASARMFDFDVRHGDLADLSADGLAVSQRKVDDEGWRLGTKVPVTFARTGKVAMTIEVVYERTEVPGDYLMSIAGYERNFDQQIDTMIFAMLRDGVTAEEGRAAIEPLLEDFPTAELKDQAQYKADQQAQISQIVNMVYALLALAVIIAVIGIANTLALSIHERTREIGLLRAVGMSRRQTRSMVRWESVIIAVLGSLLGLSLGLFFGWAIVAALRDEGFTNFAAAPDQLLVVVVLAAIVGVGAAVFPARRAARLDILHAIGAE